MKITNHQSLLNSIINSVRKSKTYPTESSKEINNLALEKKNIENRFTYIKENGKEPPQTPDFSKLLNIIK